MRRESSADVVPRAADVGREEETGDAAGQPLAVQDERTCHADVSGVRAVPGGPAAPRQDAHPGREGGWLPAAGTGAGPEGDSTCSRISWSSSCLRRLLVRRSWWTIPPAVRLLRPGRDTRVALRLRAAVPPRRTVGRSPARKPGACGHSRPGWSPAALPASRAQQLSGQCGGEAAWALLLIGRREEDVAGFGQGQEGVSPGHADVGVGGLDPSDDLRQDQGAPVRRGRQARTASDAAWTDTSSPHATRSRSRRRVRATRGYCRVRLAGRQPQPSFLPHPRRRISGAPRRPATTTEPRPDRSSTVFSGPRQPPTTTVPLIVASRCHAITPSNRGP